MKNLQIDKAREYMKNYNRSNFPSCQTIAKMFNLTSVGVWTLRNEMIKDGELTFNGENFIPNSYLVKSGK